MIEWTEVDQQEFETYPPLKPPKGRDDIDDVLDAVAAGKTVRITLADHSGVRGRRMSLGRRAKQRGFALEMRYQDNKMVVRKKADSDTETGSPGEQPTGPQPARPRPSRWRKGQATEDATS